MKSLNAVRVSLTLLAAALTGIAQAQSNVQVPRLTGTECIRDICLGDELGKFAPGMLGNSQRTQINAWGRTSADVLKEMKPLYGRAAEKTQLTIAQEHLRTFSPIVRIPMTPAIHEALLRDSVQVCGFATLWAEIEGRSTEKWSLVFTALPDRKVEGRQAWVLTNLTVQTPGGFFAGEEIRKLRDDLAARANNPSVLVSVSPSAQALTVSMRWDPVEAYTIKDPSIGALSEKSRHLFGCRSTDALPAF